MAPPPAVQRPFGGHGRASVNAAAVALAFVNSWIFRARYAAVALMWLIPDKRIERMLSA